MDFLASLTFQLFCGLLLSWCLMLDLLTNSGPLFVGWPLGLWCSPDTRIVNYLDYQSPYCQLRRQNQLLEISFSNRLKAGFYVASYHIAHWWHLHRCFYWHVISNFLKKGSLYCDLSSTHRQLFFRGEDIVQYWVSSIIGGWIFHPSAAAQVIVGVTALTCNHDDEEDNNCNHDGDDDHGNIVDEIRLNALQNVMIMTFMI